MDTRRPLIVDVRRGSLEDGPGIRTVVFFKGCPLRCVFCHNPEAQESGPELAFAKERCHECGACAAACPLAAIDLASPSRVDRSRCDLCGKCAEVCPSGALRMIGRYWPVEHLADLLMRDTAFYRHSRGGVTFSGGECTMFPEYLEAVLKPLRQRQVHVAIETSGAFEYSLFAEKVLPYLDLVLFSCVGQPNRRMLENLRMLLREPALQVHPRIPIIPGVTDAREILSEIVSTLRSLGARDVSLLPYNPLGLPMYTQLGRPTPDLPACFVKRDREQEVFEMFREILAT